MKITDALTIGRNLRKQDSPAVVAPPVEREMALDARLLELARAQLGRWIEDGADYEKTRLDLITEYNAVTERQFPGKSVDPQVYLKRHTGVYLGKYLPGHAGNAPLPGSRKEVIRDALARWLWLYKRTHYFGGGHVSLAAVTSQDCDRAALDAVEIEAQRRRKEAV